MSTPTYLVTAQVIECALKAAIREAETLLPEDLLRQRWVAAKHSPAPWNTVKHAYAAREDWNRETADVLSHLVLLSEALEGLSSVTTPAPTAAPDLSLPRTRRRYA